MANTTASARGRNKYRATPDSRNIGANTIQIDKRGYKCRCRDLHGAIQDHFVQVLVGFRFPVAVNVLDFHGRVVYKDPYRKCEPPESHDVDRLSDQAQHDDRRKNRQRNGSRNDQRAAPVPQENENHHCSQARGNQRLANHALDRSQHKNGLVCEWLHLQLRRNGRRNLRKNRLDAGDHFQGRGISGLLNSEQHRALPIHTHDVGLRRKSVADPGNVFHVDRGITYGFDRNAIQIRDRLRRRVGNVNVVLLASDFGGARRQDQVLQGDRIHYIQRRKAFRLKRSRIQIDLYLPLFAAIGVRDSYSAEL